MAIDWKRVRESIGYTQAIQSKDANNWYNLAKGYHQAAHLLDEFCERIPSDTRPFALNAALSIELILKGILAKKNAMIPISTNGHDLRQLSERADLDLSKNQKLTLELLTETIIWSGRYPAPKTTERWDDYQDRILEAHVIRQTVGNVSSVLANQETFPNWRNYLKIWNSCVEQFEK